LKLFSSVPFLNGGLFENLDKNIGKPDEVRIDCFSNRPVHEKRLKVPDFLFFSPEDQIDLRDVYGSKKRRNETVRGIIHILNSYKFTIAENTPIEEEIEGAFAPDQLPFKATVESEPTLQKYHKERTFTCQDGNGITFSWHGRMTPGAWRIYFDPTIGHGMMQIGYIGPKLPTVNYPI